MTLLPPGFSSIDEVQPRLPRRSPFKKRTKVQQFSAAKLPLGPLLRHLPPHLAAGVHRGGPPPLLLPLGQRRLGGGHVSGAEAG